MEQEKIIDISHTSSCLDFNIIINIWNFLFNTTYTQYDCLIQTGDYNFKYILNQLDDFFHEESFLNNNHESNKIYSEIIDKLINYIEFLYNDKRINQKQYSYLSKYISDNIIIVNKNDIDDDSKKFIYEIIILLTSISSFKSNFLERIEEIIGNEELMNIGEKYIDIANSIICFDENEMNINQKFRSSDSVIKNEIINKNKENNSRYSKNYIDKLKNIHFRSEIIDINQEKDDRISELETKINELIKENSSLNEEIINKNLLISDLNLEISNLNSNSSSKYLLDKRLYEENTSIKEMIDQLKIENLKISSEMKVLQIENDNKRNLYNEEMKSLNEKLNNMSSLCNENQLLKQKLNEMKTINDKYKNYNQLETELNNLKSNYQKIFKENNDLKLSNQRYLNSINELSSNISSMKMKTNKKNETSIEKREIENENLTKTMTSLEKIKINNKIPKLSEYIKQTTNKSRNNQNNDSVKEYFTFNNYHINQISPLKNTDGFLLNNINYDFNEFSIDKERKYKEEIEKLNSIVHEKDCYILEINQNLNEKQKNEGLVEFTDCGKCEVLKKETIFLSEYIYELSIQLFKVYGDIRGNIQNESKASNNTISRFSIFGLLKNKDDDSENWLNSEKNNFSKLTGII